MARTHQVRDGDCIASLAFQHGLAPDALWDHPENAALRAQRRDPNVLFEGDLVFIPDVREKEVSAATGLRHRYRRRGVPEVYRARFLDRAGRPRADLRYRFTCLRGGRDGAPQSVQEGTTDADGRLEAWIRPDAEQAELVLLGNGYEERYRILLGHLDPITEPSGLRARLKHLGHAERARDELGGEEAFAEAVERFQNDNDLPATGEADPATVSKLRERYGG